jgi:hypothetical protein
MAPTLKTLGTPKPSSKPASHPGSNLGTYLHKPGKK